MTLLERAMSELEQRYMLRTPSLAAALGISNEEVDELLRVPVSEGKLITCQVEVGGSRVIEYRPAATPPKLTNPTGHLFTPIKPKTVAATASIEPDKSQNAHERPTAPSPAAAPQQRETPMAGAKTEEKKPPLVERAFEAMQRHKCLSLAQLAKLCDTSIGSIYQVMAVLKKRGVKKVEGEKGLYQLGAGKSAPAKPNGKAKAEKPGRKPRAPNGNGLFAGAVRDLQTKRDELVAQIQKIDNAIAAVQALAH